MAPTTPRTPTSPARRAGTTRRRPASNATSRKPGAGYQRRKPAPESGAKKVLGAVGSALPGLLDKAAKPAKKGKTSSRTRGAGLALVSAGAGWAALKQRSKRSSAPEVPVQPVTTTPVSTATTIPADGVVAPARPSAPGSLEGN